MATIASNVNAGWASTRRRQRERTTAITPAATSTDQPKCSDGIAANWLATDCVVSVG